VKIILATYYKMQGYIIRRIVPVIDYSVRTLCAKKYPGHPHGCPNFNKKEGCPPEAPYFDKVYDLNRPVFAVCNIFALSDHVKKVQAKHPEWTYRQASCLLYWQGGARKIHRALVDKHLASSLSGCSAEYCPEAMGVDVTASLASVGVHLEWPPKNYVLQVALIGDKRWCGRIGGAV
jgi:hypothetical protein